MKLVILNGSSCSGKSTIVKNLMKQKERYFHVSYDSIKWSFSQYSSGKYYEEVREIMYATGEAVCKLKYNIICDSILYQKTRDVLINLAKKYEYEILEINLEADFDILSRRFDERVAGVLTNPEKRIANTSKERFKELYDIYQKEKNPSAITFKTDTQSVKEVSESILKLL